MGRSGAVAAVVLAAGMLVPLPAMGAVGDVVVNEFHYDNGGADTGEFVEVAAGTGTDLTGWSLELVNGSTGLVYDTVPLPDASPGSDGTWDYHQLATPGLQNGSPDGIVLVDQTGAAVEFWSYEGSFTASDGAATGLTSTDVGVSEPSSTPVGQSLQRTAPDADTWFGPATETPRAANADGGGDGTPCDDAATDLISTIQGADATSPCAGEVVTVDAVVTSRLEDDDVLDGYFVQEQDADADSDLATSEGLFVFCRGACSAGLAVGDRVEVSGTVGEFGGATQVDARSGSQTVLSSGNPLPTPALVALDGSAGRTDDAATFEELEGMLVTFTTTLVVSEYFELARFGSLVLTAGQRPFQFTHQSAPSVSGYQDFLADLATRRIILDDDNNDQNDAISGPAADEPYFYPRVGADDADPANGFSLDSYVRGGDTVDGLSGVMDFAFGAWRIRPTPEVFDYTFDRANARTTAPAPVGGDLTVASFNVLNYFPTIDDGSVPCEGGCRGADSQAEFERQQAKIVDALRAIDADVVGLVEIENDIPDQPDPVANLVDALNEAYGSEVYDHIETGRIGDDAIKVALIHKVGTVFPVGDHAILDSSVDSRFDDSENRPVLAQTFTDGVGGTFTVAVNHLKSKGSSCGAGDDAVDGSGNCDGTRTAAAAALADWLADDPTGSNDPDALVIGDLNSYRMERPITTLEDAGYTDLLEDVIGDDAYSYVFDGQLGYLDHALANDALDGQVTGVTAWHVNADEVNVLDYNDGVRDATEAFFERESTARPIYAPDPYRSSDHDPLVVGLDLTPQCRGVDATIVGTLGDDVLEGTAGPDVIVGGNGDDDVTGRRGDDLVCGGLGDDVLNGVQGDDTIDGGEGDDQLLGVQGDDVLYGGAGDDVLLGLQGTDRGDGGPGVDRCHQVEDVVACET